MEDCLFCKIAARQIPSDIVYEDKDVFAFNDINPQAPQHILFIPKRHIASMTDLTLEDSTVLVQIYLAAKKVAQERNLEGGYRFLTNVGPDAGQSVLHLHFHLLGGRPLKWPPG